MPKVANMSAWTATEASLDLRNVLELSQNTFLMLRTILQLDNEEFRDVPNVHDFARRKCHALVTDIMVFESIGSNLKEAISIL